MPDNTHRPQVAVCHPDRKHWAKGQCRPCYDRNYRITPEGRRVERRSNLKRRYGLTEQQYREMWLAQDGRCAICGVQGILFVDHNHETGVVRGLLCNLCNTGIARFLDKRDLVLAAARYLA